MRNLIVLIGLMVVPPHAAAQVLVTTGALVRVHRQGGETVTGRVREISPRQIVVLVPPDRRALTITRADIDHVERRLGVGPDFPHFFTLTLGVTSLGAAAVGWLTWSDPHRSPESFEAGSRGEAAMFGFVGGLILGLPVAVLAGAVGTHERWGRAEISWGEGMSWAVRPNPLSSGGLSVSGRIRVGGG